MKISAHTARNTKTCASSSSPSAPRWCQALNTTAQSSAQLRASKNRRLRDDGSEERFLDRRSLVSAESWTPTPDEMEAIRARNAAFLERGMSPAEFNRLVDEGRLA